MASATISGVAQSIYVFENDYGFGTFQGGGVTQPPHIGVRMTTVVGEQPLVNLFRVGKLLFQQQAFRLHIQYVGQ